MNAVFEVGTAKVDITPPMTIPYLGFQPRHALFQDVHDPLYARALAVDAGAAPVVIIAVDAIGYSKDIMGPGRSFTGEVRRRVGALADVPPNNIMIVSSHAHSTPETINVRPLLDTPAAGAWLEVLINQLASAATLAVRRKRPCTLKVKTGELHGLSVNRRIVGKDGKLYWGLNRPHDDEISDWGLVDHQVGVLFFEAIEGDSCIVITNFACHPITVQVQPLVSADFPGTAMALVEHTIYSCAGSLFLQGACGNLNPIRADTRDFEDVKRYGLMLGGEVIKMVGQMSGSEQAERSLTAAGISETVLLPGREVPSRETVQIAYDEANQKLARARTEEKRQHFAGKRRLAEEALIQIDRAPEPILGEVQVIRLGDVAIVGLPGEPFVELGLQIKAHAVAPHPLVAGYANDYLGYFATPEAWEQGGYEVGNGPWARVGCEGSALLVEKAIDMINTMWH